MGPEEKKKKKKRKGKHEHFVGKGDEGPQLGRSREISNMEAFPWDTGRDSSSKVWPYWV